VIVGVKPALGQVPAELLEARPIGQGRARPAPRPAFRSPTLFLAGDDFTEIAGKHPIIGIADDQEFEQSIDAFDLVGAEGRRLHECLP
jgi:hypothetical protein